MPFKKTPELILFNGISARPGTAFSTDFPSRPKAPNNTQTNNKDIELTAHTQESVNPTGMYLQANAA